MKPLALVFGLYCLALGAAADTIITASASCTAYGFTPVSNAASCTESSSGSTNIYGGSGFIAVAASSATLGLPAGYTGGTLSQMAGARGDGLSDRSWGASQASTGGEIQLNDLYTTGPIRPGFLQVYFSLSENTGYSFAGNASFSVGTTSGGCGFGENDENSCELGGVLLPILRRDVFLIPFTLGQSFDYDFSQSLFAGAYEDTGATEGTIQNSFGFLLTEADGTTPVTIYSAPEPATWVSLVMGAILLLLMRRRIVPPPRNRWKASIARSSPSLTCCRDRRVLQVTLDKAQSTDRARVPSHIALPLQILGS